MDVETPRATRVASTSGYSYEEKQSILENLDIEVADKKRRFDDYLDRLLKSFLLRQESEVTRIPRSIRGMTVREFGEKYQGDIRFCMEAMARERLGEEGMTEIDATARKRKRQEFSASQDSENTKPTKTPRQVQPSAKKPAPTPGRTPGRRLFSKPARSPLAPKNGPDGFRSIISSTPLKPSASAPLLSPNKRAPPQTKSSLRPPMAQTFDPLLPITPAFPRKIQRHESLLSMNGSPLENPYVLMGLDVESSGEHHFPGAFDPSGFHDKGKKRSSIAVHRRGPNPSTATGSQKDTAQGSVFLSVPTKDGQVLKFDPLRAHPSELEALEGITDSAKKKAKEDMVKLVQQTLSKWTL
ncbi:hypothetical protein DACRYDRAFT_110599 [Dacryopinax primogenitus]|uniref:Borealin N-terminal domain-containing protein n=1 Tax=Dacryopinax primogenitus (strain DJM 731) TaxID=1858805 RepID=M5FYS4_DACPD|nr:uncharacterized protein DACRYDRAFT_110599 [Dacryopinax primogenitus]EJT98696.1 hypothetical protein DACRYDRAFT_110599 [Dacryopinax primogenitus]